MDMERTITRRLCLARFGRRQLGSTVTLRVTGELVEIWYIFWPFRPALSIPISSVHAIQDAMYAWYYPFPALEVQYLDGTSRLTSFRISSFRSLRPVYEHLCCTPIVASRSSFRSRIALLWLPVLGVIVAGLGCAFLELGNAATTMGRIVLATYLLNPIVYHYVLRRPDSDGSPRGHVDR
jgi:hypothetical protein